MLIDPSNARAPFLQWSARGRLLALAFCVLLVLNSCRLLTGPRPPYSASTPFGTVYAERQSLATSEAARLAHIRESVLKLLPYASDKATYSVRFHGHESFARLRSSIHEGGYIVKSPFRDHSWIIFPEFISESTLAHELVHAHRSTFWQPLTRFMEEGLADYIGDELDAESNQFADAIVFLGTERGLQQNEFHTVSFLYPDGSANTRVSGSMLTPPQPPFDPFSALAAPSVLFDPPYKRDKLRHCYATAAIVMRRAILHGDEPFAALAELCEEARATRTGILDASEVLNLAGFPDGESFDLFIEQSFEQAWLDSRFQPDDILRIVMGIEAAHKRTFDTPEDLFDLAELRHLRGDHLSSLPEHRDLDYPNFRAHIVRHWPSPNALAKARAESAAKLP